MVRFAPPSKPVTLTLFKSAVSDQIGTNTDERTQLVEHFRIIGDIITYLGTRKRLPRLS